MRRSPADCRGRRRRDQEAPDLLDQVIAATRPQTDKETEPRGSISSSS